MLQQDDQDAFGGSTCGTRSVQELVESAFGAAGLDWRKDVVLDPKFIRPAEVDLLVGDPTKARTRLGWKPKVAFAELIHDMVEADLARLRGST